MFWMKNKKNNFHVRYLIWGPRYAADIYKSRQHNLDKKVSAGKGLNLLEIQRKALQMITVILTCSNHIVNTEDIIVNYTKHQKLSIPCVP